MNVVFWKETSEQLQPPEIVMAFSTHGHQSNYEYHLLKRDLRTRANPPDIDLPLSNHGHQSKNDYHLLKRGLRTAADPWNWPAMFKSWAPAQEGISSFEKKGPKNSCKPPWNWHAIFKSWAPAQLWISSFEKRPKNSCRPPEIDLPCSNHGHPLKKEYHLLKKKDLRTAATPPMKLTCHFQIMGTSPTMNIIFWKET